MTHTLNRIHSMDSENSITLVEGTLSEIGYALKQLGANATTLARASVSFGFAKIPGAQVTRVEGGYHVGGSNLPESQSEAVVLTEGTRDKFAQLLEKGNSNRKAANDEKFAIAA